MSVWRDDTCIGNISKRLEIVMDCVKEAAFRCLELWFLFLPSRAFQRRTAYFSYGSYASPHAALIDLVVPYEL